VAVNDGGRAGVEVVEDLEAADQDVAELELREPAARGEVAQVVAGGALHDQVEGAGGLLDGGDVARDAGVAELGQDLGLALEELERLPGAARHEALDDHLAVLGALCLLVARDVDLALRAMAHARSKLVATTDQRAVKGHVR